MAYDFTEFTGQTPYASELFGVYEPLLGWRSNLNKQRVAAEAGRITDEIVRDLANDLRVRPALELDRRAPTFAHPLTPLVTQTIRAAVDEFVRSRGRPPAGKDWAEVVGKLQIDGASPRVLEFEGDRPGFLRVRALGLTLAQKSSLTEEDLRRRTWHPIEKTDLLAAHDAELPAIPSPDRESAELASLRVLSTEAPAVLDALFTGRRLQLERWVQKLPFIDPLGQFGRDVADALLSPIGVLRLFREYFFEGRSFPGPAVGHVWLAPGSSLELYEIHTRRRLEERRVEIGIESTRRSENTQTEQEDLSNAVSEQNGHNTALGVTASGGVNFGVVHASTSASVNVASNRQTAEQAARGHMRNQSQRLASEMRKSVQTAFRTSVELEDRESRRYVLNNTTERLVNYELRRKMRRVGVQVQRLGAQLCWQVYIDDPGLSLALAELVHVAKPADLDGVQPPEAPPQLAPRETDLDYDFPFDVVGRDADARPDSRLYQNGLWEHRTPFFTESLRIDARRVVHVLPPEPGYELATVQLVSIERLDPEKEPPHAVVEFELGERRAARDENDVPSRLAFTIVLREANFHDQNAIRLRLKLGWTPTAKTLVEQERAHLEAVKRFNAEKARLAYVAYVDAVRERVRLAGQVARRPSEDLREEERTVIYRRLIEKLTAAEDSATAAQRHVLAELVRSVFDVDRMLYFVAPEWWNPRRPFIRQNVTQPIDVPIGDRPAGQSARGRAPDVLLPSNRLSWGGAGGARETYLVTEDSAPAPLGASLGWILQLDGDAHRNAFLNTPWVKAVIPIRRGRETAALEWLRRNHVEGEEGLDDLLPALETLVRSFDEEDTSARLDRAEDRLFEHGFDPLEGGTELRPFPVFDAWVEVLPTDQIIAVEYERGA